MEARRIGVCGAILLLSWLLETHAAFPQSTPHVPTELPVISPLASNPEIDKLVRAGKWRELVSLSTELQRKDPDNPMLLYWIGASHLQLHEAIPAVQAFRLAERLGLNTAPMHEDLGLAYYDLNQVRPLRGRNEESHGRRARQLQALLLPGTLPLDDSIGRERSS
jgi:hypothetical protein